MGHPTKYAIAHQLLGVRTQNIDALQHNHMFKQAEINKAS
jgi:hypothetical protein